MQQEKPQGQQPQQQPQGQQSPQQQPVQQQPKVYQNQQWVTWLQPPSPQINTNKIDLSSSSYSYNTWNDNNMAEICKYMKQWKINALWISDNAEMNILKHITNVWFGNLIRIDVSGNKIQEIGGIAQMAKNMPVLQQLYLQSNNIVSLKPLTRAQFPCLYFLGLGQNLLSQCPYLSLINLKSLTWLGLQHTTCQYFSNDMTWVVKLNTDILNKLQVQNLKRIKQKGLDQVIARKRFVNLEKVNR